MSKKPSAAVKVFHTFRVECREDKEDSSRSGARWRVCWYLRASTQEWAERKAFPKGKPKRYRVVLVK